MSYPPLPPVRPLKVSGQPITDVPPLVEVSPRVPSNQNSAQRYLQNRDKKLFDSADYYSTSPSKRNATQTMNGSAFDLVNHEADRLTNRDVRSSTLSFEALKEVTGNLVDDTSSEGDEDDEAKIKKHTSNSMRRSSMEEFFVEESAHEPVKHAILEKPRLKRWDSGDFFSSPKDYRKMLATQAKEVLRNALDHAEEDTRPRRQRRSSLSINEPINAGDE